MSGPTMLERLASLAKSVGVIRPRDLRAQGIARQFLRVAEQRGLLLRTGRGLYVSPDAAVTEHHTIAEAAKRAPGAVICLLSALRFHDIGTQNPAAVWIAIGNKDRAPQPDYPPLRVVRFSGQALHFGQEMHMIEGVPVAVYSAAKTVADCFKYRNKIGLDVAIEALRDCLRRKKTTPAELLEAARVCRVERVLRPYLEALV